MWYLLFFLCSTLIASMQAFKVYYGPPVEAILDERPFQAAVFKNDVYKCSGTQISEKCVVTACSCIVDETLDLYTRSQLSDNYTLMTYSTYLPGGHIDAKYVSDVFIVDGCNYRTNQNDAAVLCSRRALEGFHEPLVREKTKENVRGIVSGWGISVKGQDMVQADLHRAYMRIISLEECRRIYAGVRYVPDSALCAKATRDVRGFCEGDIGGPLTHGEGLIGIAVSSFGCGPRKYPGIFTNVSMVSKYIDKAVNVFTQVRFHYNQLNNFSLNV